MNVSALFKNSLFLLENLASLDPSNSDMAQYQFENFMWWFHFNEKMKLQERENFKSIYFP